MLGNREHLRNMNNGSGGGGEREGVLGFPCSWMMMVGATSYQAADKGPSLLDGDTKGQMNMAFCFS